MINRYTRPAMGHIWTEDNKYRCWLQVESAASAVLAEDGVIPQTAANAIAQKASASAERILEIEAEVKHDVIAFTTAVAESLKAQGLGEESRWLHYGLTSNDIVDTAQALQVKEASALICRGIEALMAVLKRRALEFKHTPTIGRTHGIHAEPTTFGLKLLNWYAEMQRNLARFEAAAEDMRVGKLSGAVGTFGHLKPEHEERICERLGLKPAPVATQVIQRDRHAAYIGTLARDRQHAGQDCGRDAAPAADGSSRSAGVLQRKAEGLVSDAAQEESNHQRADQRTGACAERELAGSAGECGAVA